MLGFGVGVGGLIGTVTVYYARDAVSRVWVGLVLALAGLRFRAGAAPPVPGVWMRVAAWLMPGAAGREWLAEAHSVMFEAAPNVRRSIRRSYLLAVGQVLVVAWAAALMGRLRARRAGSSGGRGR